MDGKLSWFPCDQNMEKCINEMRQLHEKYPEIEVREKLAIGLFNAALYWNILYSENMNKYIDELRGFYEKYPEKEVKEQLVKSLYNAQNHIIKQSYDNLILLYKLRFDLPNDNVKEKQIQHIEIAVVEETRNTVQCNYNNNGTLTDFVKNLQSVIKDNTELIILIDRVSENVPIGIQNSLYEALDELGL